MSSYFSPARKWKFEYVWGIILNVLYRKAISTKYSQFHQLAADHADAEISWECSLEKVRGLQLKSARTGIIISEIEFKSHLPQQKKVALADLKTPFHWTFNWFFFFVLLDRRSVSHPMGRVTKTEVAFIGQGHSLQVPSLRLWPQLLPQKQLEIWINSMTRKYRNSPYFTWNFRHCTSPIPCRSYQLCAVTKSCCTLMFFFAICRTQTAAVITVETPFFSRLLPSFLQDSTSFFTS